MGRRALRNIWLSIALVASSCATAGRVADDAISADPVIAAERAFAARHQSVSVKRAFAEFAAADGVALTPEGTKNVQAFIATWPDRDNKGFISWWPDLAGIARSGDLGFTTGPASFGGGKSYSNYFTIWKKQPDGSWKWVIDQGTNKGVKPAGAPGDPVAIVPVSNLRPIDPASAWADLRAADQLLGDVLHSDEPESLSELYAPDVRLLGWRDEPLTGRPAVVEVRTARGLMAMRAEGGGVSAAGDLGWTYGYASWTDGGAAKRGPYLRVWQRRADGWRVLVENISPF
jgi:ketosteroid isomerase-like protein